MTRRLLTVLLAAAAPEFASAQISLRVVGSDGQPIPAVSIDVYGLGEVLGTYETSALGVAEIAPERWDEVRRLSFSHLGYQTLILQADGLPADGIVRLEPAAIPIDGFAVEAGELCPINDDPRARQLWTDVAARYATDTGERAWLAYLRDDESRRVIAAGGPETFARSDGRRGTLEERIARDGYAWAPLAFGASRGGRWYYPEFDREFAYHFATPTFGDLHDFAIQREAEREVTLVYCAKRRTAGASLRGTLTLIPGASFTGAEWRFRTERPDEGAGGSVTFAAFSEGPGTRPHLVSARGLFYRHDGTELLYPDLPRTYARFVIAEARWSLLPTGDRPCNEGLSFFGDSPTRDRGVDGRGTQFAACVADHWREGQGFP